MKPEIKDSKTKVEVISNKDTPYIVKEETTMSPNGATLAHRRVCVAGHNLKEVKEIFDEEWKQWIKKEN